MKKVFIRPSIANLVPSATLLINERSKELVSQGKKVYRLGFGQSPFPIPSEVVDSLRQYAGEKDYLPVQGLLALREAVSGYYKRFLNLDYDVSQIMIGPGSKELILGLKMVTDADILLPSPSWVSYDPQAQIAQGKVHWIDTREEDGWKITPQTLEAACKKNIDKQKILILNYPNNPVGTTYSQHDLQRIAEVARKYEIIVIADEIYGALTFDGSHHSLATYYPEGTVVSGGLSKWCGAGGWRLGIFCFPEELAGVLYAMKALASESFSAVSAPIQFAAIKAFEGSPAISSYLDASNRILRTVAAYTYNSLLSMDVTMPEAQGGFYLFPNFNRYKTQLHKIGIRTSPDFCEQLLLDTGVALLPGSAFGRPADEFTCRLSYVDFDGGKLLDLVQNTVDIRDEEIIEACPAIRESMKILQSWLKSL